MLNDEFLNLIDNINSTAKQYGFNNSFALFDELVKQKKITLTEKEELKEFVYWRNKICHGRAGRINIFSEDIDKLNNYKHIINNMLGIKEKPKTIHNNILIKQNFFINNEIKNTNKNIKIDNNDLGPVSKKIYDSLINLGGTAECSMLRNMKTGPLKIWITDKGVEQDHYKGFVCRWEVFDGIVEKAKALGGKMYKGNAQSAGVRIGSSNELSLDTIDAYISVNFYGNSEGKSTLRRSTYYAAILAWAGICTNNRSDGEGGYIQLNPEWM